MSRKNPLTVQTWEMTLLTPLHVGDGGSHFLNQDYTANGRNIEVLDLDDILECLKDNPVAIGEMGRGEFNLSRFIREYKLSVTPRYVFANVATMPKDIRRFLKNAHGQAYVPGSSLKGALRTALLQLTPDKFHSFRDFFELSRKVKSYKSHDPHHDFLRPLHVSDSQGLTPTENLSLSEVKYFNLQAADTPGWKDLSSRRTGPNFRQAAGLFVETLKPETKIHVQVGLDEFLLSETGAKAAGLHRGKELLSFEAIAQVMNQHADRLARAEEAFFGQYGETTGQVADFYKKLLARITKSVGDGFYLRMAWGSGWRGMTGNWMSGQELEMVRKEANLGKNFCPECNVPLRANPKRGRYNCRKCQKEFSVTQLRTAQIFPKSRRLAMQDGVPALPLGWIHVRFAKKDLFRTIAGSSLSELKTPAFSGSVSTSTCNAKMAQTAVAPPSPFATSFPAQPSQSCAAPAPKKDPEAQRQAEVDAFKRSLPKPDALAGQIDSLLQAIRAKKDEDIRKLCCQALLNLAKTDKKFKSAVKDQKPWVVNLTELCAELGVTS